MKVLVKIVVALAVAASCHVAAAAPCRALRYWFTSDCMRAAGETGCVWRPERPDLGPQIAVWIESADRARFIDTAMVTNATALFGIGNRPGEWDLRSGPRFPYGRRPMALPAWAHARGKTYPLVVMQNGEEQRLTGHEGDSSPEPRFCRPMLPSEEVDAVTCPSGLFRSDKGRLDASRVSVYPPRADLLDLGGACPALVNRPHGECNPGDSESYALINDVDAVAAATPPFGVASDGRWVLPDGLPPGDYALMVEVAKEFDVGDRAPAPNAASLDFDVFGTAGNLGQPSVIFRVPFTVGQTMDAWSGAAADLFGTGDATGATGTISPPDGSISDSPGGGEGRLALTAGPAGMGRVHATFTACEPTDCASLPAPSPVPIEVITAEVTATTATVQIDQVGDGRLAVLGYEVRVAPLAFHGAVDISAQAFERWTPEPVVAPAGPGTISDDTLVDLVPETDYAVGIVARGRCGTSPVSFARFRTPAPQFRRLSGCFIATAAFGSDVAPELDGLRRVRDAAVAGSGIARLVADLYERSGPAAARVLRETDAGRALVRRALRPLAQLATLATRPAAPSR